MGGPRIAVDTETNGRDIRDGRGYCYGVSVAYRHGDGVVSFYMPFRHTNPGACGNYDLHRFMPTLQQIISDRVCIYHNAKHDLVSLSTLGLRVDGSKFLCTMKLCHDIDENHIKRGSSYSLDDCCKKYLGRPGKLKSEEFKKAEKVVGWHGMPPELHGDYAAYDTYSTLELFEAIAPLVAEEELLPIWNHQQEFIRLLIGMEGNGIKVDLDMCDEQIDEGRTRQSEIFYELGRRDPMKRSDLSYLLIDTLRLPTIYHRKTGKPTFDKNAMDQYEKILELVDNPTCRNILEYRGWDKAISSNYEAYEKLLSPDGRLRPNYKYHGTVSGRLSCEKPNLQQIPRSGSNPWNGGLKKCFIPEKGYTLLEADYSQLEFRLNAAYGEQQDLIEIFADPSRDFFGEIASSLSWDRQLHKMFMYMIAYGAGTDQVSFIMRCSLYQAKNYIEDFYRKYPGLKRARDLASSIVRNNGKIQIWSGRYAHFQYPKSQDYKALNRVIQGGAADLVERAMIRCSKAGLNDGTRSRMLLQVHDSIVFEVRHEEVEEAKYTIKECMTNVTPDFGVKFEVDLKEWAK